MHFLFGGFEKTPIFEAYLCDTKVVICPKSYSELEKSGAPTALFVFIIPK